MDLALPQTLDGVLPFSAAVFTLLLGVVALFMPRVTLRVFGVDARLVPAEAVALMRGTVGGFYIGAGLISLLLFDQPQVQIALGAAWAFAAFGRLVSLLSDDEPTVVGWLMFVLAASLAALPLSVAFGLVSG